MSLPALGSTGLPKLDDLGRPMLGCCVCGGTVCSDCSCTTGAEDVTLSVFTSPLEFVGIDECDASGYCDVLAGIKTMVPWSGCSPSAAPSYCAGGCYANACENGLAPKVIGLHYFANGQINPQSIFNGDTTDYVAYEDCGVLTHQWVARWFLFVDKEAKKLSVFCALHWFGGAGCPIACRSYTAGYIRWEYDFDSCSNLAHPAHTATKMWTAWGALGESTDDDAEAICLCATDLDAHNYYPTGSKYRGVCTPQPDEVDAVADAWFGSPCELFLTDTAHVGYPTAASEGHYLKIKNLTPPAVSITGCQDECCTTVGGPPTASMDLPATDSCFIEATDTSTPGTCGAIVKRLWLLESWSVEPTGGLSTCAERQQAWSSIDEGMEATETIFKPVAGCGQRWWRLTLIVWDAQDCYDSITSDVYNCCSCEDGGLPCPGTVGGSLGVTLTNEELCEYELCATLPVDEAGHAEGVCGEGTPFIEWQLENASCAFFNDADCDCADIFAGTCYPGCGGGLGNGDCVTVTIESSTSLRWRVWDNACGCPGPWTYVPLVCNPCDCCETENDGILESIDISLDAIKAGSSGDCADCLQFNDIYHVPGTDTCYGNDVFVQPTACIEGVEHDTITISWQITCTDTSTTLTVNVQMGQTFPAFITFEKTVTHASGVVIDCSELSGSLTRTVCACDGSALIKCNAEDITASANLNFI